MTCLNMLILAVILVVLSSINNLVCVICPNFRLFDRFGDRLSRTNRFSEDSEHLFLPRYEGSLTH